MRVSHRWPAVGGSAAQMEFGPALEIDRRTPWAGRAPGTNTQAKLGGIATSSDPCPKPLRLSNPADFRRCLVPNSLLVPVRSYYRHALGPGVSEAGTVPEGKSTRPRHLTEGSCQCSERGVILSGGMTVRTHPQRALAGRGTRDDALNHLGTRRRP